MTGTSQTQTGMMMFMPVERAVEGWCYLEGIMDDDSWHCTPCKIFYKHSPASAYPYRNFPEKTSLFARDSRVTF
jgi:hypothetical protein